MNEANPQYKSFSWHSRWKSFPHHSQVHWLVLAVLVWATGLVFMGQMVNLKNSDKQLAQAEVLGVRSSRPPAAANKNTSPEVKGEAVEPSDKDNSVKPILPSEVNLQDIRPARNMNQHLKQ